MKKKGNPLNYQERVDANGGLHITFDEKAARKMAKQQNNEVDAIMKHLKKTNPEYFE